MSIDDLTPVSSVDRLFTWLDNATRPRNPDKPDAWRERVSLIFVNVAVFGGVLGLLAYLLTGGAWLIWVPRILFALLIRFFASRNPVFAARVLLLANILLS